MSVVRRLYKKGKVLYQNQEYEKALKNFEELLNYTDSHLKALNYLSLCYAHLGDYKKAINLLEKGLRIDEENEVIWMNLTKALFQKAYYKKVIKKARKARKKFPDNEFFPSIIGVAYLNLNEIDTAIPFFKEALNSNTKSKKAWIYLCRAYDMKGINYKYDEYKPNTEISWYFLAKHLMFEKFYEEALYACDFALKLNPSFKGAFELRKRIMNLKNQIEDQGIKGTKSSLAKQKIRKKIPKKEKKKQASEYELYDQKIRKIQQKFRDLKSSRPKQESLSLDERMEKVKKRFKKLKLEGSDNYIESEKQIERGDINKKEKGKLKGRSKEEPSVRKVEAPEIQDNEKIKIEKERAEKEIYLGNQKCTIENLTFVIDGANILRSSDYSEEPIGRVRNLHILIDTLNSIGITDYIVMFDRSLFYNIDDQQEYERLLKRDNFIETPGGTQTDYFILKYAKKEDAYIISNDMFREFYEIYGKSWIREKRIAFQFVNKSLFFDKITII